ncbi:MULTISPECIES: 3-oxoadipate enol-lactonase [unclassified Meiothermus]|uniref:3-oxoadipate enol-lactonase n=1 Tax=unclassified Meiothermus TaxID=370471 RepID=UPI000D7CDA15|nr:MULTISPECIES: 3-oxoadipate enol-lactonase [unclassified Meiothermus]PZA07661.1 3-oxoadipate enol-lactonase [Meiothermus sp. Pnk-1]RYM36498.1 3-oxoadipate enol-lactonase [Meiothermus sp. PNK-Is4]
MTRFAKVNGLVLHYRLEGEGPPVVFINSLGSDLRLWDAQAAGLASRFQVVRYDKRGHGLSEAPPPPYTLADHTRDLKALLDHLALEQVSLVGISVGGMIALDFARTHPERTRALVLMDTGARIGSAESWDGRIRAIEETSLAEVAKGVIARWFTPTFFREQPAAAQGYYHMLARTPTEGYLGTCAALRDADLRGGLEAVRAPALVVCGAQDPSTPPALSEALAQELGAPLRLIEGAAHLPCIEQPEATLNEIRAFLEAHGGR